MEQLKKLESHKKVSKRFHWYPYQQQSEEAINLLKFYKEKKDYRDCYEIVTNLSNDLKCDQLEKRLDDIWQTQLKKKGPDRANLTFALWRCLARDFLACMVWVIFVKIILVLGILETTRRLLNAVADFDALSRSEISTDSKQVDNSSSFNPINSDPVDLLNIEGAREIYTEIVILATCFLLILASFLILQSNIKLELAKCGLKCRIVMSQLIFKKSLRFHLFRNTKQSSSQALGLISNEVTFIEEANKFLVYIVIGPLSIITISAWLTLTVVGWLPILLTIPFLVALVIIQMLMPKLHNKASKLKKQETNKRIDIIGSFLSSIKIVKMYAWESKFKEKIEQFRASELNQMKHLDRYTIIDLTAIGIGSKVLPGIIFLSCILYYKRLDVNILFTVPMSYMLCRPDFFYYFPRSLKSFSDVRNACTTIKQYLLAKETRDDRIWTGTKDKQMRIKCVDVTVSINSSPNMISKVKAEKTELPKIFVSSNRNLIEGLDMSLEKRDLVIAVGQVGTGKSTLLMTLLGETCITAGSITISKGQKFAYAAQEPCLFSDTLRNNILNGRAMDFDRYKRVIEVCSLWRDIDSLPEADETLVGSKGVSLSGGQKARLSLARAVYSEADVYLLDDPLSAVDAKVANHIFNRCVCEFLADKLVVLATHQVQFIHQASKVVLLRRDLKPIFGPTKEVMQQKEFCSLVAQIEAQLDTQNATENANLVHEVSEKVNEKESCRAGAHKNVSTQHGSIYWFYLKLGHGKFGLILLLLNAIVFTAISLSSDYYFRIWAAEVLEVQAHESFESDGFIDHLINYWLVYLLITFGYSLSSILFYWNLTTGLREASRRLHSMFINSLFGAKMSFYDFCEMGELSTRYGNDFAIIDHSFIVIALIFAATIVMIFSAIIPLAIINHLQLIPFLILVVITYPIAAKNCNRLRKLLELSKAFRAPVYTNLSSTIDALSTIRSDSDYLDWAVERFELSQNKLTSLTMLSVVFEFYMKNIIKIITMSAVSVMFYIIFGFYETSLNVSTVGTFLLLSIGAASVFPALLEYGSIVETYMVSVDNVRRYTKLESEYENEEHKNSQQREWPKGEIVFNEVTMRYFEDERPAVDKLSFAINGGERIGVVGRTGAGKSSIISVIYRLYPFEGSISIDGVDTKSLALADLRSSLSVIPQDPVLFHDSLRKNLDPFGLYEDIDLWRSLDVVNLSNYVRHKLAPDCLDYVISEGGRNFSAGQRQLVCLARAILKSTKVLLIDEATANVDTQTDAFIQETIRTQFKQSTIITVAHRLETILDYDRVLVLDSGRIVEFDKVDKLLEMEEGVFKSMLQSSNIKLK